MNVLHLTDQEIVELYSILYDARDATEHATDDHQVAQYDTYQRILTKMDKHGARQAKRERLSQEASS